MSTDTEYDAMFVGGPRDGSLLTSNGAPIVEEEIDGFIHRYIVTTKQREQDGSSYAVYNYDGEIDPTGAQSGVETRRTGPTDRAGSIDGAGSADGAGSTGSADTVGGG
jgi:hypothetical protein